jgi:dTDP-4-dehydrorhamnose reductase
MKILVTGSNGMLGSELCKSIIKTDKYNLIATSNSVQKFETIGNYIYEQLDITDFNKTNLIISFYKPDIIINCAALTNVDLCQQDKKSCYDLNTSAVDDLVNICKENNIKLIQISTDFVFDGTEELYGELSIPNPINFYGKCKLDAENSIINSNIDYAIVRTSTLYNNDINSNNLITFIKRKLSNNESINMVSDQLRSPTSVNDLSNGIISIIENNFNGIINIAGSDILSPYDMAIRISDLIGYNKNLIIESDSTIFKQIASRPLKTVLSINKAIKMLNYKPLSFNENLCSVAI